MSFGIADLESHRGSSTGHGPVELPVQTIRFREVAVIRSGARLHDECLTDSLDRLTEIPPLQVNHA